MINKKKIPLKFFNVSLSFLIRSLLFPSKKFGSANFFLGLIRRENKKEIYIEGEMDSSSVITPEDVLESLMNHCTIDALRLKIINQLKANEELKNTTIKMGQNRVQV